MAQTAVKQETIMFELIHGAGQLLDAALAWFVSQPMALRLLVGAGALAVLWVLWILLRVLLLALRIPVL